MTSRPVRLVLLRHGETVHTRAKRFSGSGGDDPPLSGDGAAQARAGGTGGESARSA